MQKTPNRVRARVLALFATVFVALIAAGGRTSLALADTWRISYGPGGGAGTIYEQTGEVGQSTVVKDNAYVKTGYSFAEWNTVSDGSGTSYRPGETITPASNLMVLHAIWEKNGTDTKLHTITFDGNGATFGKMSPQQVYENVGTALHVNTFQNKGYRFKGWSTVSSGDGSFYSNGETIHVTEDTVLYALWELDSTTPFSVYYDANGGTGTLPRSEADPASSSVTIRGIETITPPAGKYFVGWNTNPNGIAEGTGVTYDIGEAYISGDVLLYAQWSSSPSPSGDTRIIYFYRSSSTTSPSHTETLDPGKSINLATVTSEHFSSLSGITGWQTSDGGTIYSLASHGYSEFDDITRLYPYTGASPTPLAYSARFYINNTSSGVSDYVTIEFDSGTTFKQIYDDVRSYFSNNSIWNNNTLVGWRYGNQVYNLNQAIPLNVPEFHAVWSGSGTTDSVIVRFNSNYPSDATGTSGSMSTQTIGTSSTALNQNNFKCSNYTFKYWTYQSSDSSPTHFNDKQTVTAASFSGHISGNGYYGNSYYSNGNTYITTNGYVTTNNNVNYNRTGEVTLYAQWEKGGNGNITVTFNANGGTGTMSDQSIKSGTSTALKQNTFKRDGYTFDGWNTSANGSGTSYTNGQSVTFSSDQTLYAQWKQGGDSKTDTPTPVTPPNTTSPTTGTTPTTPTASTSSTTPAATTPAVTTGAIPAATLAATGDSTNYGIIVAAIIAGIGIIVVGLRFRKNSKR